MIIEIICLNLVPAEDRRTVARTDGRRCTYKSESDKNLEEKIFLINVGNIMLRWHIVNEGYTTQHHVTLSRPKLLVYADWFIVGWKPRNRLSACTVITSNVRKIDLWGITPSNRNRSGLNSVHMNRSSGDDVKKIVGTIGPLGPEQGARMIRQLPSGLSLLNFVMEREYVSCRRISKDIFENFHFWGHLRPKTSKVKRVKHAPYSDQTTTHCR